MKRILITGANGFVGTNLAEYLVNNDLLELIALDVSNQNKSFYNTEYTWNEFSEIDFNNIDTIIHLAGIAHDTQDEKKRDDYFNINVGLTKRVFEKYLASNAKKFIFFSSVKAVADSVINGVLAENDYPNPQTPYGQSKLEAEKYLLNHILPKDKSLFILRPAMIHGPGNKGNLNLLYDFIEKGIPYPLGAFSCQRSFTSIGNLNFIISQFINREIESGVYQVADDDPLSVSEIIHLIGEVTLHKPRIWRIPIPIVKFFALIGNILYLPLNTEKLKKLTENYLVSNKKLITALGVQLPIQARDGFISTLKYLKAQK